LYIWGKLSNGQRQSAFTGNFPHLLFLFFLFLGGCRTSLLVWFLFPFSCTPVKKHKDEGNEREAQFSGFWVSLEMGARVFLVGVRNREKLGQGMGGEEELA
jgi:hypothetical protein